MNRSGEGGEKNENGAPMILKQQEVILEPEGQLPHSPFYPSGPGGRNRCPKTAEMGKSYQVGHKGQVQAALGI